MARRSTATIRLTGVELDALNTCLSVNLNDPDLFDDAERAALSRILDKVRRELLLNSVEGSER